MDSASTNFRNSCLEVLEFLSSPAKQREFASKVKYDDYKAEFVCWWFDDLVMESLPEGTELISQSFTDAEKQLLWLFTKTFDANIDSQNQSIEELLKDSAWLLVVDSACKIYGGIESVAT